VGVGFQGTEAAVAIPARFQKAARASVFIWVWLLFGNEKSPEKSGDFAQSGRGDGRKVRGY
jgi:hypothetical protein